MLFAKICVVSVYFLPTVDPQSQTHANNRAARKNWTKRTKLILKKNSVHLCCSYTLKKGIFLKYTRQYRQKLVCELSTK